MTISVDELRKMIEISAVQAADDEAQINAVVDAAERFGCSTIYVPPSWVSIVVQKLGSSPIKVGSGIGFPSGGNTTATKIAEAQELLRNGCRALDMVINIGKLRSGRFNEVKDDIQAVVDVSRGYPVKVILECHYLDDDLICEACDLAIESGASWVKTGTGWAPTGATPENVALIKSHVGDRIGIKAAGGVRDLATIEELYQKGARAFGISLKSAIGIFRQFQNPKN